MSANRMKILYRRATRFCRSHLWYALTYVLLLCILIGSVLTPSPVAAQTSQFHVNVDGRNSNGLIDVHVEGAPPQLLITITNTTGAFPGAAGVWQAISYESHGQLEVKPLLPTGDFDILPPDARIVYSVNVNGAGFVTFFSDISDRKAVAFYGLQNLLRIIPEVGLYIGEAPELVIELAATFDELREAVESLVQAFSPDLSFMQRMRNAWDCAGSVAELLATEDNLIELSHFIWDRMGPKLAQKGIANEAALFNLLKKGASFWAIKDVLLDSTQMIAYGLAGILAGSVIVEVHEKPVQKIAPHVSISPATGVAGTSFEVKWTGFSPGHSLAQHLRRKGGLEQEIVVVTTDSQGKATSFIDSQELSPATYELWGVDNKSGINSNVAEFTVTGEVDLSAYVVGFSPSSVVPGGEFSVTFAVKNHGNSSSGSFSTWVYASTSPYGTENLLTKVPFESIAPDNSQTVSVNVVVPSSLGLGEYYITAYADAPGNGVVQESREDNNIGSSTPNKIVVKTLPPTQAEYPLAQWHPAAESNYTAVTKSRLVKYIVIHAMSGSLSGTLAWFGSPNPPQVSAHYLVGRDGQIIQMVREGDIAHHASTYNAESIGIELEDGRDRGYLTDSKWATDSLYQSAASLVHYLTNKYDIPRDRTHIIGHSEVPASSKQDPGPYWDWNYFMALVRGQTTPVLSVAPVSLAFGNVPVGTTKDMDFTVANTGGGTLTGSATTSPPFSIISGSPFNLTASQSTTVRVSFSPTSATTYSGQVNFTSNGGNAQRLVSGTGITPARYTLTVSVNPSAGGGVSLNPSGGSYDPGTQVTLTASPASGYRFVSWSGAISSTANPFTIAMDGNKSITASFTPVQTPTPTALSPGSASEPGPIIDTLTPTLTWTAVSGADYYAVAISKYPYGSSNIVYNPQQVSGTSVTVPSGTLVAGEKYRWNLQAHGPGGWSAVSNTLYFQTEEGLLPAPSLSSPYNGASNVSTTPTFSWSAVTGASSYRIMVGTSLSGLPTDPTASTGSGLVINTTTYSTSYTPSSGVLSEDTTYYWEVHARSSTKYGEWSSKWSFTTKKGVPSPPTPLSPGSSSSPGPVIDTFTPTLQWSGVSNADYYALAISKYPYGSSNIVYNPQQVSGTSVTVPSGTLVAGEKYRWNMQAHNSAGWSDVSTTLYFQTYTPVQTPTVETRSASDVTETSATLNGRIISDGGSSVIERRFDWGTTSSCSDGWTASVSVSGSYFSYRLTGLSPGTTYYFRAWARNSAGWGQGSVLSLTTSSIQPPPPPTPTSPGSSSSPGPTIDNLTPTFYWSGVSGADYYGLYIRDLATNILIFDSQSRGIQITGTSYNLPSGVLGWGKPYRWNMQAHNSAGWSSVSTTLYFQTKEQVQTPTVETRSATDVGQTAATLNGRIVSDGGSSILERRFDWGTTSSCSDGWTASVSVSGSYFSHSLTGLNPGTTYYFRAWARNSAGWSQGSVLSFITQSVQPPSPPTPTSPGSSSQPGPTIDDLTPTFYWSGVSNADYYALAISKYPYGSTNIVYNPQYLYGTSHTVPSGKLEYSQKYRWNMQAHNSAGWSSVSTTLYFQTYTPVQTPTVETRSATDVGQTTATLNGRIVSDGGSTILERRFDWGTTSSCSDGWTASVSVSGSYFSHSLTGLNPGTTYYFRAWARNSAGWSQGSVLSFITQSVQPPPPPTPTSPGSSSSPGPTIDNLTPTFYWSGVSGADYYGLYIRDLATNILIFDSQARGIQITGTSYNLPSGVLGWGKPYRWNMNSHNSAGWGSYSGVLYFQTKSPDVTLTLYVHEGSSSGPLLSRVRVTGNDGAGRSFDQTTNSSGYVTITGTPGTWNFIASKSGYETNSWSQSITSTETRHAYLVKVIVYPQITGVSPAQPKAQPTRQWLTILGSGFVSDSQVTLRIGGSTYVIPTDRTQFVSSGQIKVYVGLTDPGNWSAQVTNPGGYQSNIFSFQVVP